jgi:POT family proton-dependent oligopeptide transporter
MMGIWFLATSLGNLIAGLLAGEFKSDAIREWPELYLKIIVLSAIAGGLLMLFSRRISRWMKGV